MKNLSALLIFCFTLVSCGGGGGSSSNTTVVNNPPPTSTSDPEWLVSAEFILDGGPGKDGIPSLDYPAMVDAAEGDQYIQDDELVVGIIQGDDIRAYPHKILDWHEVVNDQINDDYYTLSYCPLTGTSLLWDIPASFTNKTFGVSGLLYNSNLILYDRETDSYWAQMLSQSIRGAQSANLATNSRLLELSWGTWKTMYPQTKVLSLNTGFSRNYFNYPYDDYLTSSALLFRIENTDDRLHPKTRVVGIKNGDVSKVYLIDSLAGELDVLNDTVGDMPVVVMGAAAHRMGVAYSRTLSDGTVLDFSARPGEFPIALDDNEGNVWDIHGMAVSGPRQGQQLTMLESYTAFWFAWVAMFPNPQIYGE